MKYKKIVFIALLITILLIICFAISINYESITKIFTSNQKIEENDFTIATHEDSVLVKITREAGIKKVSYIDDENQYVEIDCNNKKYVAMDVKPEVNQEMTFVILDSNGNTSTESFLAPDINAVLAINNSTTTDIKLDRVKENLVTPLDNQLISSLYMNLEAGKAVNEDTNASNASQIFNTWTKYPALSTVGSANYNANWSLSGNNIRTNADVSWTGYWNKSAQGYGQDITISFDSYSGDDRWGDPIGFTFRMTEPSTNVFSFYAVELDHEHNYITLARINNWAPATQNMPLHCGPLYDTNLHNCTGTKLKTVAYNLPTSTWLNTKIVLTGNNIQIYMGNNKVIDVTESDADMLKVGGYGPWVASNPYAYFANVAITTRLPRTLEETIADTAWNIEKYNYVINVNNNLESSLANQSTQDIFNNNNVYYIAVGSETNKSEAENFMSKITGGTFIDGSDTLENKYKAIADYIAATIRGTAVKPTPTEEPTPTVEPLYVYNNGTVSGYTWTSGTYSEYNNDTYRAIKLNANTITYDATWNCYAYINEKIQNKYCKLKLQLTFAGKGNDYSKINVYIRPSTSHEDEYTYHMMAQDYYVYKYLTNSDNGNYTTSNVMEIPLSDVPDNIEDYYLYIHTADSTWSISKIWFE